MSLPTDPFIFRTSGIRGISNIQITSKFVLELGQAIGNHLGKGKSIVVGRDNRRCSLQIEYAIISGLLSEGVNVHRFDEALPTPAVVSAIEDHECDAGIMITGSHLPPNQNGVIYFGKEGTYYSGELQKSPKANSLPWDETGDVKTHLNQSERYLERMRVFAQKYLPKKPHLDILIDPVHGPMTPFLTKIFSEFVRGTVYFHNIEENDHFPGRLSEPTVDTLQETALKVKERGADIGIATDVDGDRVLFITNEGTVVLGDQAGSLLAKKMMMTEKDLSIVAPINSSLIIGLVASEMGGTVYDCKVGPPAIIDTMIEKVAKLGFEESGKYFFMDESLWPDGLLAALKILSLMYETQLSLQELVDQLPTTTATKDKIMCETEEQKEKMMEFVYQNWEEFISGETKSEVKIDGMKRYFTDNSWLLIRPSGTENYIRIFCEALTPERTEELKRKATELLEQAKESSI
ncbi:MAG: hypothetical protein ACTSYA_10040 [Candidatus Kariarchaeaceae archaeon]